VVAGGWDSGPVESTESTFIPVGVRPARREPHVGRETITFVSDDTWRSTPSHILLADLIAGEAHDLRRRASWHDWQTCLIRVCSPISRLGRYTKRVLTNTRWDRRLGL
jgi:hypothetical protein